MKQGTRKLVALIVCVAVILVTEVVGAELSETATWAVGVLYAAFAGGNGIEHLATALAARAGAHVPAIAARDEGGDDDE